VATLLAGLALACGLAACSSGGGDAATNGNPSAGGTASASQLAAASQRAMAGLSGFRVSGNMVVSGQRTGIDLVVTPGTSGGSFTTPKGSFQLISDGTNAYLSATQAFWESQGVPTASAQLLAGKWVTGFPSSQSKDLVKTLNLKQLLGAVYSGGTLTEKGTSTLDGHQVVALTSSDGSVGYIASTGPPYLLEIRSPNGGAQGTVTFSGFGTAAPPTVPTDAVNLSTVGG
jgi:hypothetical protein